LQCPAAVLRNALYSSKNDIPCSWTCERDYFSNGTRDFLLFAAFDHVTAKRTSSWSQG
jgi:hypothetical protein